MTAPRTDWTTRVILGGVMAAGLVVGTWSIFTLLHERWHAPEIVAAFGAGLFDLAALFFARLAQRYATTPDSGAAPRLAMFVMVATSATVNWEHAQMQGWGTTGGIVLGGAPIVAELAFEMWHRFEHREALRAQGRVARALPVVGRWSWLLHPLRARRVVDAHVQAHLTVMERQATEYAQHGDAPGRITLERADDAAPQHDAPQAAPQPQHVVITVQQAPALPAAEAPPTRPAPQHDAGDAQHDAPAESPAQPPVVLPASAAPASPDTVHPPLDLTGLSKADAVRRIAALDRDADAPEISRRLAQHGITAPSAYVRTVLSRDKRKRGDGTGFYP